MSEIEILLNTLRDIDDCEVYAPAGDPVLQPGHSLPNDLAEFYRLCGGMALFGGMPSPSAISTPKEFVLANPVIFVGAVQTDLQLPTNDINWSWYIISGNWSADMYFLIDLDPKRHGWCYYSSRSDYPGSTFLIAKSFTALLRHLTGSAGGHDYWFNIPPEARRSPYDFL